MNLLSQLIEKLLDPVLRRLRGKEAAKMSFDEINDGCNQIKEKYNNSAKGAKDVIAAVFEEFHPVRLNAGISPFLSKRVMIGHLLTWIGLSE